MVLLRDCEVLSWLRCRTNNQVPTLLRERGVSKTDVKLHAPEQDQSIKILENLEGMKLFRVINSLQVIL